MIDSNALTQVGGTLSQMRERDRQMGENMGAGAFGALRFYGRNRVDNKRQEADEMNNLSDAITLLNNKDYLEQSGYGNTLVDEELKAQQAEYAKRRMQAMKEAEVAGVPFEEYWKNTYGAGGESAEAASSPDYAAVNPSLGLKEGDISFMMRNGAKRQGRTYVWDPNTGIVVKKPKPGVMLSDAEVDALISAELEKRKAEYEQAEADKSLDAVNEKMAEWDAANQAPIGLEGPARERRAKLLFEKDFHDKMLNIFKGDEAAMQAFMEKQNDPRFTVTDSRTGRKRLKRPDELYFDLGNYANFWAPEMAEPYFRRSSELTDLLKGSYDRMLNATKTLSEKYETFQQHAAQRFRELSQAVANAEVVLAEAEKSGDKEQIASARKLANEARSTLTDYIRTNSDAQKDYGDKAVKANDLYGIVAGMRPEDWANTRYSGEETLARLFPGYKGGEANNYESLLNEIVGDRTKLRDTLPADYWRQLSEGAEAVRAALGPEYSGMDALEKLQSSGLFGKMNTMQIGAAIRGMDAEQQQALKRYIEYGGRKLEREADPFNRGHFMQITNATSYDSIISAIESMLSAQRAGNTSENARIGVFTLGAGQRDNRAANTEQIRKMSPADYARAVRDWFKGHEAWWPKTEAEEKRLMLDLMQKKKAADAAARGR